MKKKKVFIIAGPTAAGKTALAIELSGRLGTEIISADSRQCYREMNIGVARPSSVELAEVPHHFIASHSIQEKVTAATFETYALEKAANIFRKKDNLVMVGGTGMYIKAFCEGLDHIPDVPENIRQDIIESYQSRGMEWLQEMVRVADPAFYQVGEIKNPHRLMRALEVVSHTGQSILSFRRGLKSVRDFEVIKLAITPGKDGLHGNINHRVDEMMRYGLLEEVRSLFSWRHLNALQTVGYKELFHFLEGKTNLEEAIDQVKMNTRQYAKRQLTWFRKDKDYTWFAPGQREQVMNYVGQYL